MDNEIKSLHLTKRYQYVKTVELRRESVPTIVQFQLHCTCIMYVCSNDEFDSNILICVEVAVVLDLLVCFKFVQVFHNYNSIDSFFFQQVSCRITFITKGCLHKCCRLLPQERTCDSVFFPREESHSSARASQHQQGSNCVHMRTILSVCV